MATKRAFHNPQGDPCTRCGLLAIRHLVEHHPKGDPCTKCGLPSEKHFRKRHRTPSDKVYYVGIDGEGQGREDHRYVMLAWSNESGTIRDAIESDPDKGLTSEQCLDFILSIPGNGQIFAFAFNYDITKILTDCPDDVIYMLARPELRQSKPRERNGKRYNPPPKPVPWGKYKLNYQGAKFVVEREGQRRVIWDVFKFFQSRFTKALEDWFSREDKRSKERIWTPPETGPIVERMAHMKELRADFDKLSRPEILQYCYEECALMAQLAHKLTDAHEAADLKLTSYFGAGSTSGAMLKVMGIQNHNRLTPANMTEAVACAFFGGRFENLILGAVDGPIWGYDISSAYPYQLTFLPCLECGRWERTTKREALNGSNVRSAVVRYSLGTPPADLCWGPFPFRLKSGAIAFPSTSGGGWVWLSEYLEGERLFPHVQFHEAWVYRTDCTHRPFERIPKYYLERLRIGKEGPGIVIKLGCNACYGKLAQSLGMNPPFQCWIWAGMITAGTRSQILQMLGMHRDWRNMLMVATDGIYSREKLDPPKPLDTGTGIEHGAIDDEHKPVDKPLGGWERTVVDAGMFAARPGIYFPLGATEKDAKKIRGRGVGRKAVLENMERVVQAWRDGKQGIQVSNVSRFHGFKSSIGRRALKGFRTLQYDYVRFIDPTTKRPRYGQWSVKPVDLSFNPLPKRGDKDPSKWFAPDGTLAIRAFPGEVSLPYEATSMGKELAKDAADPENVNREALDLMRAEAELLEQPDGEDYSDYSDS